MGTSKNWKNFKLYQNPGWENYEDVVKITERISKLPAIVFSGETRRLRKELCDVEEGKALLLHCGYCSETFSDCHGPIIHNMIRIILQMSFIISYITGKRVIRLGRIAGQYAKPRTKDFEVINGIKMPVYRGDMINSFEPVPDLRKPSPMRILEAYFHATATMNLIRAFMNGGYASLNNVLDWNKHLSSYSPVIDKYKKIVDEIAKSLKFIKASKLDLDSCNETEFYISHEALILEYEEALTRIDTLTGELYDTSAHYLWVGDRTRQIDSAHIEFLREVNNPIGIKVGPGFVDSELLEVIRKLNPFNEKGKISIITRFGVNKVESELIKIIEMVDRYKLNCSLICDPMHGNTFVTEHNLKYRKFDDVLSEIKKFFYIVSKNSKYPGGVHLEITSEDVTECLGGIDRLEEKDLHINYDSACDPRLNGKQSLELAFMLGDIINSLPL